MRNELEYSNRPLEESTIQILSTSSQFDNIKVKTY